MSKFTDKNRSFANTGECNMNLSGLDWMVLDRYWLGSCRDWLDSVRDGLVGIGWIQLGMGW